MAAQHVVDFKVKYTGAAIDAAAGSPIFPETVLTAAALESNWGRSILSAQHNNFFGVKAGSSWKGNVAYMKTNEQDGNGNVYTVTAKFRKYATAKDCFADYVKLLALPRYVNAGVAAATTPEEQFTAIKKGGYATDVNYPAKLAGVLKTLGGYFSDFVKSNPGTTGTVATAAIFFFLFLAFKN